jgi:hypothetical protein
MTGEDADGETTQFRLRDETLVGIVGSFNRDHMRIADERTPESRREGQNSKRDEGTTTRTIPRIVVAEQWLCFLLGLTCMICGIYGLFVQYNQDSSFAYIRWLGAAYGPILRSTAIACFVLGAVLVRCGLASPDQALVSIGQKPLRSVRTNVARASNLFSAWRTILGVGLKWKGEDHHERRPR